MECAKCGAGNRPEATSCEYCGASLTASVAGDLQSVLDRIKASDAFAESNSPERRARLPTHQAVHKVLVYGFFGLFIGMSAFMFVAMLGAAGGIGFFAPRGGGFPGFAAAILPLFFAVIPLGFVAIGIAGLLAVRKKFNRLATAPVEALPVVVVDKRRGNSGTYYFVTCEAEDGTRQEYQVWDGRLFGRMAPGDGGILYLKSGYGLDFDRVRPT